MMKQVQIWNVTTGDMEAELKGHTGRVRSVAFSQDGSQVVSGSDDRTVRIWNVTMGEVEAEVKGHTDSVMSVCILTGRQPKSSLAHMTKRSDLECDNRGHGG